MKKELFLGAALLMSAASFAQGWVKPDLTALEHATELVATEADGDSTIYYLYNVEGEGFLANGLCPTHSQWATHVALQDEGHPVLFQKYYSIDEAEDEAMPTWDGKTYIIRNYGDSWGNISWFDLFAESEYLMYFDGNGALNNKWEIVAKGNGIFNIKVADVNPDFNDDNYGYTSYMGFDAFDLDYLDDENVKPLTPMLDVEDTDNYDAKIDWMLITEASYLEYAAKMAAYKAAVRLGDYLAEVTDMYPDMDASAIEAVYNNTESTVEQLNAAYDALTDLAREAEVYAILEGATEDDPRDGTSLILNSSFDEGNGWEAPPYWIIEPMGVNNVLQDATYSDDETGLAVVRFMESWIPAPETLKDGKMYQILKNVPAGKYVLGATVMTTYQGTPAHDVTGVELYATGGSVTTSAPCNTPSNKPREFTLTFVSTGGDMELGLRTISTTANWICADEFTLMYYGPVEEDPYKIALDAIISSYETEYSDLDNVMAENAVKEVFSTEMEKAKSASEGFEEEIATLTNAYKALKASITDYKTFETIMTKNVAKQTALAESYPELAGQLGDLYTEWEEMHDECTATSEYIATAEDVMNKMIVDYITENIEAGNDLTALIINQNFDTDFSGWTVEGTTPAWGGIQSVQPGTWLPDPELDIQSGLPEVYRNPFDLYQVIYNLPKGSYILTCQAFERNDEIGDEACWMQGPEYGINATVYANNEEAKVNSILAFAQEEQMFDTPEWYVDLFTDYGWKPNSMTAANYYFATDAERYLVKVYFSVENDGDSVKIGIKTPSTASWVIWDNFRLTYNGQGAEAYTVQIDDMLARLEGAFGAAESYGIPAQEKVDAAISQLEKVKGSANVDDCIAALNGGKAALEYAQQSVVLYAQLTESLDLLANSMDEYQEIATEESMMAAAELFDEAIEGLDNASLSNEEAQEMYDCILAACSALKLPDYSDASKENPVDMTSAIVNPSFGVLNDFTGWEGSSFGAGGDASTCAERFNMNFDTYQDIYGLPAGYYIVKVQGFYRRGSNDNETLIMSLDDDSAKNAKIYAVSSVDDVITSMAVRSAGASVENYTSSWYVLLNGHYYPDSMLAADDWFQQEDENGYPYYMNAIVVKVGEDGKLRIGVKKDVQLQEDWTVLDNWQLFYTGDDLPDAIKNVDMQRTSVGGKGIYTLAGQKLNAPQKGLNIIDGKKVYIR